MLPAFGLQVSLMLDANGCNTTASAAVRAVEKHISGPGHRALVLGGTGPVGQRAALLLAQGGFDVLLASRSLERSQAAANAVGKLTQNPAKIQGIAPIFRPNCRNPSKESKWLLRQGRREFAFYQK